MPAVIDTNVCDRNWAACFPAKMCPEQAFSFDNEANLVLIDDSLCGDCPGPCVNFCDQYAIRYTPDHSEFEVLKKKTSGELTEEEAADELVKLKEAEEEKARAEAEAEEANQGATINATTATFNDLVLKAELPVIVDFWAPWCGPCQQMAPVFEKLAEQYSGNILFVKVNTDEEPQLAAQYQITSLPTTALFWQGQLLDTFAGALAENQLASLAYQFLSAIRSQPPAAGQTPGTSEDPLA